jgi:hypothetical protein
MLHSLGCRLQAHIEPKWRAPKVVFSNVRIAVAALVAASVSQSPGAYAQSGQQPNPPVTAGTKQMPGGNALFGTTYTFLDNGARMNIRLVRAEYSVTRFSDQPAGGLIPKAGEKLIILHFLIKNPQPVDQYISGQTLPFETVGTNDETRKHSECYRRMAGAREPLNNTIKPGQALPNEVLAVGLLPADGGLKKIILDYGRLATKDTVTRYWIGKVPNVIAPLAPGDRDLKDATGATALTEVPAKVGVTYPLGAYDATINSVAYVAGPIGSEGAGDGNRFLVVTVTAVNKLWAKNYMNNLYAATLLTDDDEKTKDFLVFKGKRDELAEGREVDPDESVTYRLAFKVPAKVSGKKLTLAEVVDNSGGVSRALVFDLTGIQ